MEVIDRLDYVISALSNHNIRADRGYPVQLQPLPETPIAAVTVVRASQRETVVAVDIFTTAQQGGRVCEERAQYAAKVLRNSDGRCEVGACAFDEKIGLFTARVLSTWKEYLVNQVRIDGKTLVRVTDFSAVQTRQVEQVEDEKTGEKSVVNEEVIWTVAIQELLPFDEVILVEEKSAFTLELIHNTFTEIFPECYWLSITIEEGDGGLIRKRIARSWTERIVEEDEQQQQ